MNSSTAMNSNSTLCDTLKHPTGTSIDLRTCYCPIGTFPLIRSSRMQPQDFIIGLFDQNLKTQNNNNSCQKYRATQRLGHLEPQSANGQCARARQSLPEPPYLSLAHLSIISVRLIEETLYLLLGVQTGQEQIKRLYPIYGKTTYP